MQAAFVTYGGNRHGFLPFNDIHPDYYRIPVADREALAAAERADRIEDEEADVDADEVDVDDADVMKVIGSVCKILDITPIQAADAFGDYWVNNYSQAVYSNYYRTNKTAKDFMLNLDSLHVTMTKTIDNAHPPRFTYEWKNDKTLVVDYKSRRGLIDFAIGLTKGVGKYYKENLEVTKLSPEKFQIVFN